MVSDGHIGQQFPKYGERRVINGRLHEFSGFHVTSNPDFKPDPDHETHVGFGATEPAHEAGLYVTHDPAYWSDLGGRTHAVEVWDSSPRHKSEPHALDYDTGLHMDEQRHWPDRETHQWDNLHIGAAHPLDSPDVQNYSRTYANKSPQLAFLMAPSDVPRERWLEGAGRVARRVRIRGAVK